MNQQCAPKIERFTRLTLDGLGCVEIMFHGLYVLVELLDVLDDDRLLLQYQSSGNTGVFALEFFQIMTLSSSNIYQHHGIFLCAEALSETLLHWIEVGIHPTWTALAVTHHVVVEGV